MSIKDIDLDVEKFFTKYTVDKGIDGIEPEDIEKVFLLYMCQHLIHKDYLFSEKWNWHNVTLNQIGMAFVHIWIKLKNYDVFWFYGLWAS